MTLLRVISGGQTGVDQGALYGAREAGLETGGFAPANWMTELGPQQELLRRFNLKECRRGGYAARTLKNVQNSDGALLIGDLHSGTALTQRYCLQVGKPIFKLEWPLGFSKDDATKLLQWLELNTIETLNAVGNRESKNPGIFGVTRELIKLIARRQNNVPDQE